jgi:hypothetical protein
MKKIRLTKIEQRAHNACVYFAEIEHGSFQVIWKKSRTWGSIPSISWHGGKASIASGCGYDKLSAVVAYFLQYLPGAAEVVLHAGAGISSVQKCLLSYGWQLKHTYNGKTEDGFELVKIQGVTK